jgi:hypothetical protein
MLVEGVGRPEPLSVAMLQSVRCDFLNRHRGLARTPRQRQQRHVAGFVDHELVRLDWQNTATIDAFRCQKLGRADWPVSRNGASGERLLKEATDDACKLSISGAPTCAIGSETFWADNRLADALSFAAGR